MKKVRFLSLAAILALGSFVAPQTASAYKYYGTQADGSRTMFRANSPEEAAIKFADMNKRGIHGVLTKRPNGGIMIVG